MTADNTPSLAEVIAPDYSAIARSIAETIAQVTKPLTDTQRTLLAASLGVWHEKLIAEARTSAAALRDEDARDAARYRWLRDNDMLDPANQSPELSRAFSRYTGGKIDAAIDAATQPAAQERQA